MRRIGQVIRLRPERAEEYERLHAAVWPEVLARITASGIRNYTIYLSRPEMLLFATWEYHGDDFAGDMEDMKADPATQRWWQLTDPCQEPLIGRLEGEWWSPMAEIFYHG